MVLPVFVVTGASKGIGRDLALELAHAGHCVYALARASNELDSIGSQLGEITPGSVSIECDLSNPTSIMDAAEVIIKQTDFIGGIVHNAGAIGPVKPMAGATTDAWSHNIQVNLIGVQDLTQRLYSLLGRTDRTRITAISSGASQRPIASWSAYCVSKAGLDMWSRCLAEEGKSIQISSVSVAPGVVDTGMQLEIRSAPPEDFPSLQSFIDLHENGNLSKSATVAKQLLGLVTSHTMEQSGQRFDVREL